MKFKLLLTQLAVFTLVAASAWYSRNNPLERICRDVRMFSIGGGTAQILKTVVAARILGQRLPQRRDRYT